MGIRPLSVIFWSLCVIGQRKTEPEALFFASITCEAAVCES